MAHWWQLAVKSLSIDPSYKRFELLKKIDIQMIQTTYAIYS